MSAVPSGSSIPPIPLWAGEGGALPLPWLEAPLRQAQAARGHALLVVGAPGSGALPLLTTLAQGWLCEADGPRRPCGVCGSCRLAAGAAHPDLQLLLPAALSVELGLPLHEDDESGVRRGNKPSRQIRVGALRDAIDSLHLTSARGRGLALVLHPAEAMNAVTANALLKTLEEPPAGVRLVLSCTDPDRVLPTVRSRCHALRLAPPPADEATAWLRQRGIDEPGVLLAAADGQPLDALAMQAAGIDGRRWAALPKALAQGRADALAGWPLPQVLRALHRLCHDLMACAAGASARYFPGLVLARPPDAAALGAWNDEIVRIARHADHPWNEALVVDALVGRARQALATLAR